MIFATFNATAVVFYSLNCLWKRTFVEAAGDFCRQCLSFEARTAVFVLSSAELSFLVLPHKAALISCGFRRFPHLQRIGSRFEAWKSKPEIISHLSALIYSCSPRKSHFLSFWIAASGSGGFHSVRSLFSRIWSVRSTNRGLVFIKSFKRAKTSVLSSSTVEIYSLETSG